MKDETWNWEQDQLGLHCCRIPGRILGAKKASSGQLATCTSTDDDSLPHQVRISMRDRLLSVEKLARIVAVNQIMLAMAVFGETMLYHKGTWYTVENT